MSTNGMTGSAAPMVGPAPTGTESGAVGMTEKELIGKLLDAFPMQTVDLLLRASIKVSLVQNLIWYRITWNEPYNFTEFMNWFMMLCRSYSTYRALRVEIEDVRGQYVIHIGLPKEGLA